ncbi:Uncharacterized protein ACO02O_08887 [Dirofilaria immitis]
MINPQKLWVIFDALAKTTESPSLNECLYQRLVMLPSLVGITLRNNGDGGCREGIPTRCRYITNRITEIKEVKRIKFRYVKIADSPADLASGGALSKVLKNSLLWWNDSNWMVHLLERWPRQEIGEEVQEKISEITSATKATIIDAKRFSSLQKVYKRREICFQRLRLGEGIGSENPQSEVSLEVIEKWGLVRDTDGIWRSLGRNQK